MSRPNPEYGELVHLHGTCGKNYFVTLKEGKTFNNHNGIVSHEEIKKTPYGSTVKSSKEKFYFVLEPDMDDRMKCVRRQTQIIYPKDAGRILFKLGISNGSKVIEAGSGSGAMSIAFASTVGPEGHLYTYEARKESQRNAKHNIDRAGLSDRVTFIRTDITEGFDQDNVDAIFLDVREPWLYLEQVKKALKIGGYFGALIPTVNQVQELLNAFQKNAFTNVIVEENFQRAWKPVSARLRPTDSMTAHTSFLLFARHVDFPRFPQNKEADSANETS